jgi:hypothetical protein
LGLTGGIVDIGGLYDCLVGIFEGKANLDILDKYDTIRREKYWTIVDPTSSQNFERLWGQDPDTAAEKDPFFLLCHRAAKDKELSQQVQLVSTGSKSPSAAADLIGTGHLLFAGGFHTVLFLDCLKVKVSS